MVIDFLFNYDMWAFGYATWQAGMNMIPATAYRDFIEAWAITKESE